MVELENTAPFKTRFLRLPQLELYIRFLLRLQWGAGKLTSSKWKCFTDSILQSFECFPITEELEVTLKSHWSNHFSTLQLSRAGCSVRINNTGVLLTPDLTSCNLCVSQRVPWACETFILFSPINWDDIISAYLINFGHRLTQ